LSLGFKIGFAPNQGGKDDGVNPEALSDIYHVTSQAVGLGNAHPDVLGVRLVHGFLNDPIKITLRERVFQGVIAFDLETDQVGSGHGAQS